MQDRVVGTQNATRVGDRNSDASPALVEYFPDPLPALVESSPETQTGPGPMEPDPDPRESAHPWGHWVSTHRTA